MKAKRSKDILKDIDDSTEIFIRNSVNICGNIAELEQVEEATYGFFGVNVPCIILNTSNSKDIELDSKEEVMDFIKQK